MKKMVHRYAGQGSCITVKTPFDTLDYYPLVNENGDISEFAEVKPLGEVYKEENKSATNKLHIGAKLGLKGFVEACVDFTIEKTRPEKVKVEDDSSGYSAQIGSSGDYAQIGSSGYSAQIGSSGNYAQIGSSGYSAQIGSSGNYAQIGSSGYSAQIGSSGDYAKITSEGRNTVVMAAGYQSIARAKVGSWITLAEWEETNTYDENGNQIFVPKCVKTERVDGECIKEDTFYRLEDGEFKEVQI